MKRGISIFIIISICCLLFSACIMNEIPEFLPGQQEGDENFVWVCKEPFAYLYVDEDAVPKGKFSFKDKSQGFFLVETVTGRDSYFCDIAILDNTSIEVSFGGKTQYFEECFITEIKFDYINFFGGELPTLRFEKMTKDDFLEKYGEVENVSELLE